MSQPRKVSLSSRQPRRRISEGVFNLSSSYQRKIRISESMHRVFDVIQKENRVGFSITVMIVVVVSLQ